MVDRSADSLYNLLDGIVIDANYKGPHLTFPLTLNQLHKMVQAFKRKLVSETFVFLCNLYSELSLL